MHEGQIFVEAWCDDGGGDTEKIKDSKWLTRILYATGSQPRVWEVENMSLSRNEGNWVVVLGKPHEDHFGCRLFGKTLAVFGVRVRFLFWPTLNPSNFI